LTIAKKLGAAITSTSPAQAVSPPHSARQMMPLPRLAAANAAQHAGDARQRAVERHLAQRHVAAELVRRQCEDSKRS
jgi:hypothetical protein